MIYDKWRTGRSEACQEVNEGPSMVEPCYNPSIRDYLTNPTLVARNGIYDQGEEVEDDLPDNWSDEPLYSELPARADKPSGRKAKRQAEPASDRKAEPAGEKEKDDDLKEKDDDDDPAA